MEEKYKALGLLRKTFKILAFIAGGMGVLFFIIILIAGGTPETPRATSLLALALGVIYFLFFYTISEVILLFSDIEENTRRTRELLEKK
ncbi:hypothetical protein GTN66_04415 [bacterium]|nr:hypothetical protein [bacterium]NIN92599.1 hypothetical protein [bacterium]NIO18624.1 hypothetical protein [bacterium]NIO73646.1 hypothetical protein [bacterium]